jgi:predicted DNA-binding ribbon-helix-helix protein
MSTEQNNLNDFAGQPQQARVLQHKKRRHSVRLESVFWRSLERAAAERGIRLSRLVAELAANEQGNSLSSYLRSFCMLEAERRLLTENSSAPGGGVADAVASCPNPGFILSHQGVILYHNEALARWLGPDHQHLIGSLLGDVFRVSSQRPLREIWCDLSTGRVASAQLYIVYVLPGRAVAAQARLVPIRASSGDKFNCVAWLITGKKGQLEESGRKPESLLGRARTAPAEQERVLS